MQPQQRHVSSVSDLYAADEVELLLEEIRDLEPASYRADEIQDFEIAGSQTGGAASGGGRSPAGTEQSWDSHAHYHRAPPAPPMAVAPLHCHLRQACSVLGATRILIILAGSACCACVWAAGGAQLARMPLAGRLQLLLLAALSSVMLHTLFLFLDITRLAVLFPLDWDKLTMWVSTWSICSLTGGSGLVMHAALNAAEYRFAPEHILQLMLASSGLGLSGALAACVLALVALRRWSRGGSMVRRNRSAGESSNSRRRMSNGASLSRRASSLSVRAYRPLPMSAPPSHFEPQPCTSRHGMNAPL